MIFSILQLELWPNHIFKQSIIRTRLNLWIKLVLNVCNEIDVFFTWFTKLWFEQKMVRTCSIANILLHSLKRDTFYRSKTFESKCNKETVDLEMLSEQEDITLLHSLLTEYKEKTGSEVATRLLHNWPACVHQFVKVYS